MIESYRGHPKIQIEFNESNSGCVFKQWNKGLRKARGEYVWIAESDDYAAPKFFETLVKKMEENSSVRLAFCDSFRVTGEEVAAARERWFGEFLEVYQRDFVANGPEYVAAQMLFFNTIPNASSALFRRELAEKIGGADEFFRLSGDWLFWIQLLKFSDIAYVATPLNFYRYHEQTARHANLNNGVMIEDALRISTFVLKQFRKVSPENAALVKERLTSWYIETMVNQPEGIPLARRRLIQNLAAELDPAVSHRLLMRRTGISWLRLGIQRRWKDWFGC